MPPHKRPRLDNDETFRFDRVQVPIHENDLYQINTRDTNAFEWKRYLGIATSVETIALVEEWLQATSWAPLDSQDLALDEDDDEYNAMLEREIVPDDDETVGASTNKPAKTKAKKPRSEVSRRPNVVWKKLHRQTYLDELVRLEGRGEFVHPSCVDCLGRKSGIPGPALYCCVSGCAMSDLVCKECCVRRHSKLFLHRIQRWTGTHFKGVSLKGLGLRVQLNHTSMYCTNPTPCHSQFVVLHTNGIHEVAFDYCGCARAIPQHIQLFRRRLYPSSQLVVKTCASFELLSLLHKLALTTKSGTYDFYRALEKQTDGSGITTPKSKYKSLLRMLLQWRHLMLLLWAGIAQDPGGAVAIVPGQAAVKCPSCPYPGINLPIGWTTVPDDLKFLYCAFVCMDANFRLKNQLVSNYSQDPGLGLGLAYMLPRREYEGYVLDRASEGDISTCVGFQAIAQANTRFSKGLRYTGVGGAFCGRSEMVMPLGIGNLQKGERYANMDYIFGSAIHDLLGLSLIIISYDIACQWFKNLYTRMSDHWPNSIRIPESSFVKLTPAIPKLHEPMHQGENHEQYSLNFIPGVGLSDCECPERVWAAHNAVGTSTKSQGPGSRQDVLDDNFNYWNWLKVVGMGRTLMRKYLAAVSSRNVQREAFRGLTDSLDDSTVTKWLNMCTKWEENPYPKTVENPFVYAGIATSEADVRKQLAKEEANRLAAGEAALHDTGPSKFIGMALDIEDSQYKLKRVAKGTVADLEDEDGDLEEQRGHLRMRIRAWEILVPIYMPGLLQYNADRARKDKHRDIEEHPEDQLLTFPLSLPADERSRICHRTIIEAEERMRTCCCYDSLEEMRHALKMRSRLLYFKQANVRGQREGTRSRAIIARVVNRAIISATKYRRTRLAKLALTGPGAWEDDLRALGKGDIRGYSDPTRHVPQGRKGTLEDDQVTHLPRDNQDDADIEDLEGVDETEEGGRHRATGQTHRTLSWIWVVRQAATADKDEGDDILRVEWAKSRARAKRAEEEVLLLREEMRQVLEYLAWKLRWWRTQGLRRKVADPNISRQLNEGLLAHSIRQADMFATLESSFCQLWATPLTAVETDKLKERDNAKTVAQDESDAEVEEVVLNDDEIMEDADDKDLEE